MVYQCHQSALSSYAWWISGQSVSQSVSQFCVVGGEEEIEWECGPGCSCDRVLEGSWLEDSVTVEDKSLLPVMAVALGDTGTPLDQKAGRVRVSPLRSQFYPKV